MTILELMGMAVNRLGLSPAQFYDMTPEEYYYSLQDYKKTWNDDIDIRTRLTYESIRLQTIWINQMNPYVKKKITKPTQLIRFPWEIQKKQTVAQMKQVVKAIATAFGSKKESKKERN